LNIECDFRTSSCGADGKNSDAQERLKQSQGAGFLEVEKLVGGYRNFGLDRVDQTTAQHEYQSVTGGAVKKYGERGRNQCRAQLWQADRPEDTQTAGPRQRSSLFYVG
jgi:hypothetical protein